MSCPKCGNKIKENHKFCECCGYVFESVHKWRCDSCGGFIVQFPCEHCGFGSTVKETHETSSFDAVENVKTLAKNEKTCSSCGKQSSNDSQFCSFCGKRFASEPKLQRVFCPDCGTACDGVFCPKCGNNVSPIRQFQKNRQFDTAKPNNIAAQKESVFPMKYHKWMIYFELFAAMIYDIWMGIKYITGGDFSRYDLIEYPEIKVYLILMSVSFFVMAILSITTRSALAKFKCNALDYLVTLRGVGILVSLLGNLFLMMSDFIVANPATIGAVVGGLIGGLIQVALEIKYYKRRSSLFVH